ncbi:MAG: tRNA 2-selenouridine(34) synthase MnmH [Bacteroidales bacterium]|nr:tRNA 2-selenouridine(34) synthase MnmH [Bacteroidales bacterium]
MKKTNISEFLKLADNYPIIDVRSPSEFKQGHIPGAINIPLFDDHQRETVGISYARQGRIKAILTGLELIGPSLSSKLKSALKLAHSGKLLVHCWRGGMRSETMAWLFSLGDIETFVLEGGYKSYRNHILNELSQERKIIVLGGLTGSGKTKILQYLKEHGHQVIDLEKIACHKGSAFGWMGQEPQPTSEHFANLLFDEWKKLDFSRPVWIEDESSNIGNVFMPSEFYDNMQKCRAIILMMDIETRIPGLLADYTAFPPEMIKESINRISKRLGAENAKISIRAVENNDFATAIRIILGYYDKSYLYGLRKKESNKVIYVETATDDVEINALKVLEASEKIVWNK